MIGHKAVIQWLRDQLKLDPGNVSLYLVPAILPVYEYMLLINFGLNTALWRRQAQGPTQARSRKHLFISGLKEGRGIWTEVKASSITDRDPT
ncbi:DNA mismatch repair protein MSH1, mitochondrial isoform E [Glycine soja]|uniref:DNA mismatch repair protein MSH1, mitochondrial isoform D n=1 Tax=Glycine soja TaxID=3848 RepID=A0A445ILF4_GLYSO|nr:DNA mismatch repair protein MSH1, mitochondrial isoform D [Glycine soja]RZB86885.1 DNA mismatch repair protein MSH1, mitochondrial isoform E [Glycine soja]